jgi:hypothetical protein
MRLRRTNPPAADRPAAADTRPMVRHTFWRIAIRFKMRLNRGKMPLPPIVMKMSVTSDVHH